MCFSFQAGFLCARLFSFYCFKVVMTRVKNKCKVPTDTAILSVQLKFQTFTSCVRFVSLKLTTDAWFAQRLTNCANKSIVSCRGVNKIWRYRLLPKLWPQRSDTSQTILKLCLFQYILIREKSMHGRNPKLSICER